MVHEVDKDSFEQSRHLLQNDIIWFCQHYSGSSYVMVNLKSSHKIGCGFRVSRIDFLEGRGLVAITILEWMNRSCKVNIRPSPCMQGTFLYKVCTERKVQQRRFWFLSAWTYICLCVCQFWHYSPTLLPCYVYHNHFYQHDLAVSVALHCGFVSFLSILMYMFASSSTWVIELVIPFTINNAVHIVL